MSYILLTRPLNDTIELEKSLQLPVLKAPLLHIELILQENKLIATDYNNLIVTSARSLRLFSEINTFLKKPIWCVGAKTARLAKDLGFETIYAAENSATELCQLILFKTTSQSEKFLHIGGECLHYDITKKLREEGYQADKITLYKTIPVERFETDVLNAFLDHRIAMIPIFSHKTAEALANVVRYHKLEPYLKNVTLVACSQQNTVPLQEFNWKEVIVTKDLSVSTLTALYQQVGTKGTMEMPLKKLWPWLAATALTSIFLSLVGTALWGSYLLKSHKPIDATALQKDIKASLKAELLQEHTKSNTDISGLKTQVTSLTKEIETLKKEFLKVGSIVDGAFKTYILVIDVQDQLRAGKIDLVAWQEMVKLLQESKMTLPENLLGLKEIPLAKEELLQQLKNLKQPESTQVTTQSVSKKLTPQWLKKILKKAGQYTGPIVISKIESPLSVVNNSTEMRDDVFNAVNNDDEAQLKALIEGKEVPENIKDILKKAQKRLQILKGLKELKSLLWQLSKKK